MAGPDLILHNGLIVTLDGRSSGADALSVRGGRIASVGAQSAILSDAGAATRLVDLRGRTVVPGFFDAHAHMDREGLKSRGGIAIAGIHSIAEIVEVVREAAVAATPGEWIVLMPLGDPPLNYINSPGQLKEGRFPNRHDLDAVSPGHPVYIRAVWGWWSDPPFPAVANSRALAKAGVTRDTAAPYNVEIQKDDAGEPTGVFLERNRAPILEYTLFKGVPRFSDEDRVASVTVGSRMYSAAGTTAVYEGHGLTSRLISAYHEVQERRQLTVRTCAPVSVPSAARSDHELTDLFAEWAEAARRTSGGDDRFGLAGVTLDFGDPQLAAIIAQGYPYEQWAGHHYQALSDERFVTLAVTALRLGLRVNTIIHNVDRVLPLFEAVNRQVPIRDRRCVGYHLMRADDDQLRRIRDLGLVVTMVPTFLYLDAQASGLGKLGAHALPVRRVLDAGIPVVFSTDNRPCSMLWAMWAALARRDRATNDTLGESDLTREEALQLSTQAGHYLAWDEDNRGSITVGKRADLAVLSENPLTCDLDRLRDISVDLTVADGEVVHERTLER